MRLNHGWSLMVIAAVSACSSMTGYRVAFRGEQTGYKPEDTPSIYILPHSQSIERTLDITALRSLESALRQMGYATTSEEKADVYVVAEAWIDSVEQKSNASLIQPASVTVITSPTGTTRIVRSPEHPLSFPISVKLRYPRMSLVVVDGEQFRTRSQAKILWRGDSILPNGDLNLDDAIPYLIFPLITSFGTQSKGVLKIDVSSQQAMEFK